MTATTPTSQSLSDRIEAMNAAVELASGRLAEDRVVRASNTLAKVRERARHGSDHTLVALVGPTGVGKSALFNALVGRQVSDVGVRRPTTAVTHAGIWGDSDPAFLDWIEVDARHHVDTAVDPSRNGLILLDVPDFDSTAHAHRLEAERVVGIVDLLIWVADPQKYADETLHRYIRHLDGHGAVMWYVVNKIDTMRDADRPLVMSDFAKRLDADGLAGAEARLIATSTLDGTGLQTIREVLAEATATRRAITLRLTADLRDAARELQTAETESTLSKGDRRQLVRRLSLAAGVEATGRIVADQHRHAARDVVGWIPARLLARRRPQPISTLPRVGASPAARAEVERAVREFGDAAAEGLPSPWSAALRRLADSQADEVSAELTKATSDVSRASGGDRPSWWVWMREAQRAALLAAGAGAVWLALVAVASGFLAIDTEPLLPDSPGWSSLPLPSVLVIGGVILSVLLAYGARLPVAIGARRRQRRVAAALEPEVAAVADRTVVSAVDDLFEVRRSLNAMLAVVNASSDER